MIINNIFDYFVLKVDHLVKHAKKGIQVIRLKRNGCISGLKGKKALFYLPFIATDDLQRSIFFSQKYYENDYLDYLCDSWHDGEIGRCVKDGIILDIGSNIGNHSLYFLLERGAKFAYCFEPAKETFEILKKNMEMNHLENCSMLYNVGVGRGSGSAYISMSKKRNTAYTQISLQEEGNVKIVSIDELGIKEKITFVKIDVEGFELEVLKGMQETLKRDKPLLMIEIWKKNLKEVYTLMDSLGYSIETMIDDGSYNGDYVCYISNNKV